MKTHEIAADRSPVALALIARIRELESACRCAAVALRIYNQHSPTARHVDEIAESTNICDTSDRTP